MNFKLQLILASVLLALLAPSCQDEEFGYTQEEIFRSAYERNFEQKYGPIAPDQSWDFSTHPRFEWEDEVTTRALGDFVTTNNGYFEVDKSMIDWIEKRLPNNLDNSSTENFGIIMSAGEFAIIPLYENGNSSLEYELHMVVHDGAKQVSDEVVWSRSASSSRNTIQIKEKGTQQCSTCNGLGYHNNGGTGICVYCNGKGYFPGGSTKCPVEGCVNGIISSPCPNSNCTLYSDNLGRDATIKCPDCRGRGWKFSILTPMCTTCGGKNAFLYIGAQRGSGHPICSSCNGAHKITRNCGLCQNGNVTKCPVCVGSGKGGVVCDICDHTGYIGVVNWVDLAKDKTTAGAVAVRTIPTYVDNSSAPVGSVVYFYLKARTKISSYSNIGDIQSSLDNKMKIIQTEKRPENISTDQETGYRIIGVEEQQRGSGLSMKDYNDLVFMVVGKPLPQVFEIQNTTDPIALSTIEKRYMFEDFGSKIDWDFNDIVIDAVETKTRKLTVSSGKLNNFTDNREAMATVKLLSGTLPLQVSFGDGLGAETISLPKISDPTYREQTNAELEQDPDHPVNNPIYQGEEDPYWTPKEKILDEDQKTVVDELEYSFSIKDSNWTPANNKVSIRVWKLNSDETNGESQWMSKFPENGEVPYIIATDVTVDWIIEGSEITEEWFQSKTENARNNP